jgi:hypothetical protein
VYVFDGSSIIAVGLRQDAAQIFELFGDLIHANRACFCDEVLDELSRLAREEQANTWAKAIASSRCHKGASYKIWGWVAQNVPDLIDHDAEHEGSSVGTLALARELEKWTIAPVVVTEDIIDKPTRLSLTTACQRLSVSCCRVDECVRAVRKPMA